MKEIERKYDFKEKRMKNQKMWNFWLLNKSLFIYFYMDAGNFQIVKLSFYWIYLKDWCVLLSIFIIYLKL